MERREIIGSVLSTTLASNINNSATSIDLTDGSTFPTGATAPFTIIINRGQLTEEKILITSRAANTLTVASRGYDGVSASAHTAGETIDHVLDATVIQDMNTTTYDNQVLLWAGV
jgi:hypothetical protein